MKPRWVEIETASGVFHPATPLHIKPPNETCFNTLFATKYPLKATFFKNRIFPRCFGWLM